MSGENTLVIEVVGTAANGYHGGTGLRLEPEETGLLAAPVLSWTE